ncbi:AraC family transcriptional regulator [Sinorhizobium numidicum]|uniref:AraC family transcriptional regulator n=1 Tax=Sinorhizobium numidicum TaxID=680248 RepID=A0ABY8CRT8_9HYPH|nr:AraC family transcriptional regulator [Sinorhizobium numidicum]WEX75371.1 AraC family transcriptional regulator [Sinorhizobium numidicum]WEX81366.1 AraC family transcriptional regulator [Sinorhizobium numidicum]
MEIIRPLKFGMLPDRESRLVCRSILLDMLGEATIAVEDGDLAGVTGLFWKYVSLSLATLYFPKAPLRLTANGVSDAGIVIMRAMDGPLVIHHRRNKVETARADVIFLPADASSEITLPEGGRFDCAHLPAYALASMRDILKPMMMQPLAADCLPLQLLTNYAGYLLRQEYQSEEHAGMMVAHFYDLLPVLAQHVGNIGPRDTPQSRMASIKTLIEENLANGAFSITDVAEAEGVTPRAIQKFFSREGTTFSRYMLGRRLSLAKGLILAEGDATSISQIAYTVGFNDLSYFNRTFRSRYGVRPSDLRRLTATAA